MTKEELISKSEVEKILKKYHRYSKAIEEIESLHTFSPEAIIEEEIEKLKNTQFLAMIDKKIVEKNRLKDSAFNSWIWEFIDIEIGALQELRSDVEKMEEEKDFNVEDIVMRKPEHKTVKYTMTPSSIK